MQHPSFFNRARQIHIGTLLTALAALPALGQQRPKKLINFGVAIPDTVFMRDNIATMEQAPFDGTAFDLSSDPARTNGVIGDFSWGIFGTTLWTKPQIQTGINALKVTQFNKFTDNFLRITTTAKVNHTEGAVDWFDPAYNTVLSNLS